MPSSAVVHRIARFGLFDLDPRTGELRKRGARIRLQQQPVQVLALLVERAGDLVSREELRERLWPDGVFVDFEQGLNNAVRKIRTALGDSAESPHFVETLERRGYRFVASVEWVAPPEQRSPAMPATAGAPVACVSVIVGDRSHALPDGSYLIGRDPAASIRIDSTLVSRRHAQLVVSGSHVSLEDLGSRNGTFVNGVRLDATVTLSPGDQVRLGTLPLSVRIATGHTETEGIAPRCLQTESSSEPLG